jgi:hypothetical protein
MAKAVSLPIPHATAATAVVRLDAQMMHGVPSLFHEPAQLVIRREVIFVHPAPQSAEIAQHRADAIGHLAELVLREVVAVHAGQRGRGQANRSTSCWRRKMCCLTSDLIARENLDPVEDHPVKLADLKAKLAPHLKAKDGPLVARDGRFVREEPKVSVELVREVIAVIEGPEAQESQLANVIAEQASRGRKLTICHAVVQAVPAGSDYISFDLRPVAGGAGITTMIPLLADDGTQTGGEGWGSIIKQMGADLDKKA